MKVLMLNGSSKSNGNTNRALLEIGNQLAEEGIDFEIFQLGGEPVRDCIGCGQCSEKGCVFSDDKVNDFIARAKDADGFVFGTPVYYAHPSGRILSFLDRVFYSGSKYFAFKPQLHVAAVLRRRLMSSINILEFRRCLSFLLRIGIWFTAAFPAKLNLMQKDFRQCGTLQEIWRGF